MESNKLLNDLFLTMRNDYAGWDVKQARHAPSPFVTALGQAYYDRRMSSLLVLQTVSQYCAGMRDRNLHFALTGSADYKPFSRGFTVRRCTQGMFVDTVTQETRLKPGDEILQINRTAPARIVKNLPNPLLAADEPEREQWNGYLKLASHLTVRHADGRQEELTLQCYPPEPPAAPQCTRLTADAVLLAPGCLEDADAVDAFIQANRTVLDSCRQLILDLRGCGRGGCEEALLPLLPYIASADTTAEKIFGDRSIRTNYTKINCARLIRSLRLYLTDENEEIQQYAREAIKHFHAVSGQGWTEETVELCTAPDTLIPRRGPARVAVLIDTWCEDAAEQLAQIAQREGRAVLIGRPSMGTLDYCTPVSVQYDEFTFTYPISRTLASLEGHGVDEKGIVPQVYVPWTPEECSRDVLATLALERLG